MEQSLFLEIFFLKKNWGFVQFHRGTYTSHGSIKKGNRHSEILLRDVEVGLICNYFEL